MVSVSYSDLHDVLDKTTNDISATDTEALIDLAIDTANLYTNNPISNMNGGAPGAKTVTVTSAQRAYIFHIARILYYSFYKDIEPVAAGGLAINPLDILTNPTIERWIRRGAAMLADYSIVRT